MDVSDMAKPSLLTEDVTIGLNATDAALNFLQNLDVEVDLKYLLFDDSLVTVSDTGKELGEFSVTIEPTNYKSQDLYLIHANSHGAVDGVPCGTSITCYVNKNLETFEQQHHEYVKLENSPLDRKTFIIRQEDGYIVNRILTQGEDVQRTARNIPLENMKGFISEGANLLLHRLLIEKGLPEDFTMLSFDSDATICCAIYKSLEDRTQTIEGVEMVVRGLERTIASSVDLPTTWQSYFLQDGHLSNRVQVGSPVTMKLAKLPKIIDREEEPAKPTFEKTVIDCAEDLQMYSNFLDRKAELKNDHSVYIQQHPEIKALLADFLQFLLLRKPADVLAFASEYFAAFANSIPSVSPYLASNSSTPYPVNRTNANIEKLRTPTR